MSTSITRNKTAALAGLQALISGTQKHFPSGSFTLGNTAYTTASLVQAFQGLADAMTAVNTAHTGLSDALTAENTEEAKVAPLVRDYTSFLRATFSTATVTLADFGLQPAKARQPLDTEQRAAATAKLRATRAARGTTSKKQKLTVKGNVTGVVVTPVTSEGASPPTATPPTAAPPVAPPAAPAPAVTAPSVAAK